MAALLGIASRLGLMDLINQQVPKRDQGPSVGHYMLLAALNRALDPCSKLLIGDWYERTILKRIWRFPRSAFSSQRFWDHMDLVSAKAIDAVQDRLAKRIEAEFGREDKTLFYDTTNFFTFISTVNDRSHLAQRGHSKAKRHDLRQVGLALLVTGDYQVPLFHRVYAGNVVDVTLFPSLVKEMLTRHKKIMGTASDATLVFDKGNVSDEAMERIVVSGQHFVAALSANRAERLLAVPLFLLIAPLGTFPLLILLGLVVLIGLFASGRLEESAGVKDPGIVVIDEVAGYLLTMVGSVPDAWHVTVGFFLFRFFDILKPFPVRMAERTLPGGVGIMVDDLLAGCYAWLSLRLLEVLFR